MAAIKSNVQRHYDKVSPYYQQLWGNHIHHGYYVTGKETKETATENLTRYVVEKAAVKKGSTVLDVGCGVGGTSIWLTEKLDCTVTGVTISPIQVAMANENARRLSKRPRFVQGDAEALPVHGSFDHILAFEMVSHLPHREKLFTQASALLKRNGTFCVVDWMKADGLSASETRKYIAPIEDGMIVTLSTVPDYVAYCKKHDLQVVYIEDISEQVRRTWDVCLAIILNPALWKLARDEGKDFVAFLKSFQAMRRGFASGAFRYVILVAKKRR